MLSPRTILSTARGILTKNSPFYVQYYIIAQCHLACRMCNIVEANSDLVPASLEDVEKIAVNLRKIGGGVVLLTGGEPFLHKNIGTIVRTMVKQGLSPRLQTAGLATKEQLHDCHEGGARHINISLDSLIEEKQDYLNGNKKGSWRAALKAIASVNEVFSSRRRLCALGCVLSRFNHREIPAMIEFATRIGWWVSLVPVHITRPSLARNFQGTDGNFSFGTEDHADLDALQARLLEMKKSHLLFDSETFLKSAINYLKTGETTWRRFNGNVCDSPSLYFAVLPNGDFAVCCDHRFPQGLNLADPNFPKTFRSSGFRSETRKITSACSGCNYGSYPEVTLLARDKKALIERSAFFMGRKNPKIPKYSFEEIVAIAQEVREAHGLGSFQAPDTNQERPPALVQRYGETALMDRKRAVEEWRKNNELLRARAYKKAR